MNTPRSSSPETIIISCTPCGRKNRVPVSRLSSRPVYRRNHSQGSHIMTICFIVQCVKHSTHPDQRLLELKEWSVSFTAADRRGDRSISAGNLSFRLKKRAYSFIIFILKMGMKDRRREDVFVIMDQYNGKRRIVTDQRPVQSSLESILSRHYTGKRLILEVNKMYSYDEALS